MTNKTNKKIINIKRKFKNKIATSFDIPRDLLFDIPRVTTIGNIQLYIENHIGLIKFSNMEIILQTKIGDIVVNGSDLVIRSLYKKEIFIEGIITGVSWSINNTNGKYDI